MFEKIRTLLSEVDSLSTSDKEAIERELKQEEKTIKRSNFKSKRLEVDYEVNSRFLSKSIQDLEEKNKLLEQYVESNLQLENFAHIASHDLKAPLNNVLSFGNLLQKTSAGKLNDSEEQFLKFIIQGANNMKRTINALLQFSLVTNKKLLLSTFSPLELLNELQNDLASTLNKEKAILFIHSLPETITGDAMLFREVFQNLILNGIKFTETSVIPKIAITSQEQDKHWLFSIKDNGIGIPEEFQKKIFIMLQRLNVSKKYKGTGMGLSICKKIIEQHGGTIWVESQPNLGSTFFFTIAKKASIEEVHSN